MHRLIGLDPGLRITGWGIIDVDGSRLRHVADGVVRSAHDGALADRLHALFDGVARVIEEWGPHEAALEETFVNKNPASTLKLGQARGAVMLAPARAGLTVTEYAPTAVKKAVVAAGRADKAQIAAMVKMLLPGAAPSTPDAGDALAVAICHAHHRTSVRRMQAAGA